MQRHLKYVRYYLLIFLLAFGLKYHYSRATSEQLGWILAPTARMVGMLSGISFEKEYGEGYINRAHYLIIAPSCAGVNFLIASFCMAGFSFLSMFETHHGRQFWLLFNLLASYLLTVFANAARILLSILFYQVNFAPTWFSPDRIHRLEGIIVYCFFLYFYHVLLRKSFNSMRRAETRGHDYFVKIFSPFFWYQCIVLLVPFIHQAYRKEFQLSFEHTLSVITSCLIIFLFLNAGKICCQKLLKVDKVRRVP